MTTFWIVVESIKTEDIFVSLVIQIYKQVIWCKMDSDGFSCIVKNLLQLSEENSLPIGRGAPA